MDANGIESAERVPASRKLGSEDAAGLLEGASRLVVAKGRKVTDFDAPDPGAEDVVAAMLGPTGNLRAPTLKVGGTVVVGFNEERYTEVLLG